MAVQFPVGIFRRSAPAVPHSSFRPYPRPRAGVTILAKTVRRRQPEIGSRYPADIANIAPRFDISAACIAAVLGDEISGAPAAILSVGALDLMQVARHRSRTARTPPDRQHVLPALRHRLSLRYAGPLSQHRRDARRSHCRLQPRSMGMSPCSFHFSAANHSCAALSSARRASPIGAMPVLHPSLKPLGICIRPARRMPRGRTFGRICFVVQSARPLPPRRCSSHALPREVRHERHRVVSGFGGVPERKGGVAHREKHGDWNTAR